MCRQSRDATAIIRYLPLWQKHAWLIQGKNHIANNFESFLAHTLQIDTPKQIGLVRCDSGFYDERISKLFKDNEIRYIIADSVTKPLKQELLSIKNWVEPEKGIQLSEFYYQAHGWSKARRMIVVRQNTAICPKAVGKILFTDEQLGEALRYGAMVTDNTDFPPSQIWTMNRSRANAENRIKELKEDFGMEGFCMKKFAATEWAFLQVMIAYSLLGLFRQVELQIKTKQQLSTI
jgi:hypothetical protein